MTPDHNEGSPGVKLTKTPGGHDCFSPALYSKSLVSLVGALCREYTMGLYAQLGEKILPSQGRQHGHLLGSHDGNGTLPIPSMKCQVSRNHLRDTRDVK